MCDESFSIVDFEGIPPYLPPPPPLILVPQTAVQACGRDRDRSIRPHTRSGPLDHAQFWFSPVLLASLCILFRVVLAFCRSGVCQPIGPAGVRQPVDDIIGGDGPGPDQNRPALTLTSTSSL